MKKSKSSSSRRSLVSSLAKPFILSGGIATLLATTPAAYADTTWTGTTSQDWTVPANWSNGLPSGQNAFISSTAAGVFPIIASTPGFTPNDIYVGGAGTKGRLDQTGGTASTGNGNWLVVGMDNGAGTGGTGTYNLSGGSMTTNNSDLQIGRGGGSVGTVNVSGGTLNVGATLDMGDYGGNGTLNLSGGGTVNANGETWVGQGEGGTSTGAINITGGTFNANSWFVIGRGSSGGNGTVTISGGSLVKNATGQLIVGDNGDTGILNLNGGTVTTPGLYRYGTGTVNFNGGTLQANASNSTFIDAGLTVNVNAAGGTIDSNGNTIGTSASLVTSAGGVLTKAGSGAFTLGGSGDNISIGAIVTAGTLILGKTSNGGVHALGGDLTINGGATAQLGGSGGDQIFNAATVTSNGTFDMAGQTETINKLSGSGVVETTGAATTLTIGANNGTASFTGVITSAGGNNVAISKIGTGTATLGGSADNVAATATVSAGTLILGKTSSSSVHTVGATNATALTVSGGTAQLGGSGGDQIFNSGDVVVSSGAFDLNDRSETIRNLSLAGTGLGSAGALVNAGTGAAALTATGGTTLTADTTVGVTNSGASLSLNSAVTGGFKILKAGAGTLVVNPGTSNSFAPTEVDVNAGTLKLGASDQIGNSTAVVLNGGTFASGGFSEGTRANGGAGLGTLTLSSNSTLDFGSGNTSILHFSGVGAHTATSGPDLAITNWDGTSVTGGATEALLFDGLATTFTAEFAQSDVSFNGTAGYNAIQYAGYYEITAAVPEPGTIFGALAALGLVGYRERRRCAAIRVAVLSLKS